MRYSSTYREADQTCLRIRLGPSHLEILVLRLLLLDLPRQLVRWLQSVLAVLRVRFRRRGRSRRLGRSVPSSLPRPSVPGNRLRPERQLLRLRRLGLSALRGRRYLALRYCRRDPLRLACLVARSNLEAPPVLEVLVRRWRRSRPLDLVRQLDRRRRK
jgi:hypothetical protein